MFKGIDIKIIRDIKKRLGLELKDLELPLHRKTEVESLLYYSEAWLKEKED